MSVRAAVGGRLRAARTGCTEPQGERFRNCRVGRRLAGAEGTARARSTVLATLGAPISSGKMVAPCHAGSRSAHDRVIGRIVLNGPNGPNGRGKFEEIIIEWVLYKPLTFSGIIQTVNVIKANYIIDFAISYVYGPFYLIFLDQGLLPSFCTVLRHCIIPKRFLASSVRNGGPLGPLRYFGVISYT